MWVVQEQLSSLPPPATLRPPKDSLLACHIYCPTEEPVADKHKRAPLSSEYVCLYKFTLSYVGKVHGIMLYHTGLGPELDIH